VGLLVLWEKAKEISDPNLGNIRQGPQMSRFYNLFKMSKIEIQFKIAPVQPQC
jgi:hypothetical protein